MCAPMNTEWRMYEHSKLYDEMEKNILNATFIKEAALQHRKVQLFSLIEIQNMDKFEINLHFTLI